MSKPAFLSLLFLLTFFHGSTQRVIEFGVKPSEFFHLNFETYVGIGNQKSRWGILFSFRPRTQDSGLVKSSGSGAAGGYDHPYANRLYTSYTLGLYQKTFINKNRNVFLQTDAFYRKWYFNNRIAEFRNAEGYNFRGTRTENINLWLKTFVWKHVCPG